MYTLLSGFYHEFTKKEQYFVLILGLDNAGKTTLLERIKLYYNKKGLNPEQIIPTVGLNMGKVMVHGKFINFWDLGGQNNLRSIWDKYYDQAHAVVFVVDSTDKDRMEECKETFEKLIRNEIIHSLPVLMLANKQDLEGALKIHEIQQIFNQIALNLEAMDSKVMDISALNGNGVLDAVEWLYTRLQYNREERPPIFVE